MFILSDRLVKHSTFCILEEVTDSEVVKIHQILATTTLLDMWK